MAVVCSNCGSASNSTGATVCNACGSSLPTVPISKTGLLTTASGRKYVLSPSAPTLIGSHGCTILVMGTGIEPQHAKLTPLNDGFLIEAVMGTIMINGKPISGPVPLVSGDGILVGNLTFTYSGSTSALPVPSTSAKSSSLTPVSPSHSVVTPTFRGGTPPAWLSTHPQVRGAIVNVDYKSSTFSTSDHGSTTSHVYWIRIKDIHGDVTSAILSDLPLADFAIGDEVGVWGSWNKGSLYVDKAFNYSTNAIIRSGWTDAFSGIIRFINKLFS